MSLFRDLIGTLFRERHPHSTEITVSIPTQLYMALETLVYIRNNTSEGEEVDRDYIVGVALAHYCQYHMTQRDKPALTPPPEKPVPLHPDPRFTSGRRQARSNTVVYKDEWD